MGNKPAAILRKKPSKILNGATTPTSSSSSPEATSALDNDVIVTPRLDECGYYRIGILGERATGKSSLFFQLTQSKYVEDQDPDEESTGRVTLKDDVELELIDTTSSINSKIPSSEFGTTAEKFQGLALQAINVDSCHGFILCFSLARKESFEALKKYYEFILAVKSTAWWPLVLVGTHSDIVRSEDDQDTSKPPRAVSASDILAFCSVCHDAPYVEISAKEGTNLNVVLRKISRCIKACTTKAS